MNGDVHEGYARLPEDLLRDLLTGAGDVIDQVNDMLSPAIERRDEIRQRLLDAGLITTFTQQDTETVAGIDGGFAVERTSAVDMCLSVAVGVEGLSEQTTPWEGTQYEWWTRASKHDSESERLARGVMVSQEIAILSRAPHSVRILDGSHLTLVIQLNTALTAFSEELRAEARRIWQRFDTVEGLAEIIRSHGVIAMPKYDSSRVICDQVEQIFGQPTAGDDKYLLGLTLEAGELLVPQTVPDEPWRSLHFNALSEEDAVIRDGFEAAIQPLREREIQFTYFKPDQLSPAFRIELKAGASEERLNAICSTLSSQITGPFVREPYPQYLADVMAKSVGLGLSALQTAVQLGLSGLGRAEIAEMLIHSYRTEGV